MKKTTILLLLLCFIGEAQAQDEVQETYAKHDITVSFGCGSHNDMRDALGTMITAIFGAAYEKQGYTGAYSLQYMYNFTPTWSIGAILTHQTSHGRTERVYQEQTPMSRFRSHDPAIMLAGRAYWFHHRKVSMYSKLAAGIDLHTMTETSYADEQGTVLDQATRHTDLTPQLALQVSAIGLQVGTPRIAATFELGYGNQGLLNFGLRTSF